MSNPPVREQFLVISVLGNSPMRLTHVLARACLESRCALGTTQLSRHGGVSALLLQASGSWDALARLEASLPALAKRHDFQFNLLRSSPLEERPEALPYLAHINAAWRADILADLCCFFIDNGIELEDLMFDVWQAPQTSGSMLSATLTITLPADTQISWLREQFLDFADALNIDAVLEPWRPSPTV